MYSDIKSVQILISLMKQYNIKDVVLSPGGSDIPLIHSIETDDFFSCYSVVDERSASYFAMGLAQGNNRPAACICTSGTAVCNYLPGITEAFYQDVPVLAITADKNPYFQGQLEIQKIDQSEIFNGVIRKSVDLPLVTTEDDAWLCNRLINEALLELSHHGTGPVHINIPIVGETDIYDCAELHSERVIKIVTDFDVVQAESFANKLSNKKILIVVGQNIVFTQEDIEHLNSFFDKYNCVFAVEHLSNLKCKGCINTYPLSEMRGLNGNYELKPDIVISIGNNLSAYQLKPFLRSNYQSIQNWLISEHGVVRDAYKSLAYIFECPVSLFFSWILQAKKTTNEHQHSYYLAWKDEYEKIGLPEFEFGNFYVAQKLSQIIPKNSLLHLAILNSTRVMQYFNLADGVSTYSNVGALGIDGCFSTFAGQAASTNLLAFLLIGDLSFFYDMNAAKLRSIGKNVRIVMLNNGGGSEFHFFMGKDKIPTINSYVCAEHCSKAEGWISSLGYEYYSAKSKDEFDNVINKFGDVSDKPLFMEVFTDMESDAEKTKALYDENKKLCSGNSRLLRKTVKKMLTPQQVKKVKYILRVLKDS